MSKSIPSVVTVHQREGTADFRLKFPNAAEFVIFDVIADTSTLCGENRRKKSIKRGKEMERSKLKTVLEF